MNRIRLLPEQVANQIAAGEVIERPASVVKELIENALDAQATQVGLDIQGGGRSLVRVSDDGIGMSRDDALLSLERHATSKIRRAEDLAAIATMGFRGEALPSIASVSRFSLTTRERTADSPEGTQILVHGGKIIEVKAAGSAPGTTIEVRQLFFNLPARRKFLRSEETETAHIQHYLTLAALAFPEVGFRLQKDGRLVWHLPGVKSGTGAVERSAALRERLRALYGDEQKLLPVEFTVELAPVAAGPEQPEDSAPRSSVRVWGFIGAPGVSRATRQDQHLFVNRRPVENRGLNFALLEGYHTSLMKGRYPVCCLFLELDPAEVDVNIHPAKREVKFHREGDVRRAVAQAVRETLLGFHGSSPVPKPARLAQADAAPHPPEPALPNFPSSLTPPPSSPARTRPQPALPMGFKAAVPAQAPVAHTHTFPAGKPGTAVSQAPVEAAAAAVLPTSVTPRTATTKPAVSTGSPPPAPLPLLSVPLRLVGVIGRLYVVLESDRGLVLLDQHAAHERILFEQMVNRLETHDQAPSQKLLLAETVELSARDAVFLREQLSALTRLGVGLSEFGERTFLLDALPPFVKVRQPRQFVLELIDQLKAAGEEVNSSRLGEHTVAKTVCRHAVKAHDPLGGAELENLIADLRQCAMPYTCPHGRPTLIEMNFRELEKKFGRTQ
jgi:DNA mismatch repair protein MutL